MDYDGKIDIATGMSARSKTWKNKTVSWSKIVKKLAEENKTNETYKEYLRSHKDDRLKIKDVGGYVGGYLRNGRRKPENVVHRQLITLDVDFGHLDFWEDFIMIYHNAAVVHATHTHSPENPKFRLIMPLSRDVSPDEYVAISRRVAGNLGIELFDNTGFQPYRLMFWPSNSKDIEYYYRFQDGPFLDADEVLESYIDWRDSSLWPTAKDHFDNVDKITKKQEDPRDKKGIIGAFCRTYGISEVIETFLADHYTQATEGRYTYVKGSTAAGLVIYDDLFAYSHHGTDPISSKLCNAFDLVRIHLYGHIDTGTSTKESSKQKSFKAMEDFARNDKNVKRLIAEESLTDSKYDFAEEYEGQFNWDEEDMSWTEELEVDGKGAYLSTAHNLNIIFANDPRLKGLFKYNLFDGKRYLFGSVPWRTLEEAPAPIKDVDFSGLRNYIECIYSIVGSQKIEDAIKLEFEKRAYHPVREYLDALEWDGENRLEEIPITYLGSEDTKYTRTAFRKTLVGAVARVMRPGVKFDLVLTLVGPQGIGKSTLFSKLAGGWFSDSFMTVQGTRAFEQLQGVWVMEMAELSALKKAEIEATKHFLSKREDTFRPAYGRVSETFKRQCIFIGTTNNKNYLTDPTGNRRFVSLDVRKEHIQQSIHDIKEDEVKQIWAEAAHYYNNGEALYFDSEMEALASQEQKLHFKVDSRRGMIENYIDLKLPSNWNALDIESRKMFINSSEKPEEGFYRDVVCIAEIWTECLGKNPADMDRYKTRELNEIMKTLEDWEQIKSTKNFPIYGKQKYYSRII